ncbi:MAG TPA: hypothetical protein VJ652_15320, partial [Noviherbaspirillum sp.]|nr:hypothetical protein [Noviherbaspirillum sp.]
MARIRTVKPELLKHEELFDLEKETGLPIRIAFVGLFTCCDREGRFKWRPRTLKLDILPHDELDFSRVLDALWTRGFVRRYVIDGEDFGVIPTFRKHQVINNKESESELPEPDEFSYLSVPCTRDPRVDDVTPTPLFLDQGERKGKEGKGTGKEGGCDGAAPPIAAGTAIVVPAKPKPEKEPPPTGRIWMHYAEAYERRYGTAPVRNATVNGQLAQLLTRLGAEEAPMVAAWFVGHNNRYYVQKMHAVGCLLADAEKLRTEWAT